MKKSGVLSGVLILLLSLYACGAADRPATAAEEPEPPAAPTAPVRKRLVIEKQFLYDKYTLEDRYAYKDTFRVFQWDKIGDMLRVVDSIQQAPARWGVLQNRRNKNGEAPLVREWVRNDYKRVSDLYGRERWQSVPLYPAGDSVPERYGNDGSLVQILPWDGDSLTMKVSHIHNGKQWTTRSRYVKPLSDSVVFTRIVFVDVTNQNVCTMEKADTQPEGVSLWLVRSMNPATTGAHNPPYAMETPTGIFLIQEKKPKMLYTHDGRPTLAGYAPWANRFCNGGYVHGVPTNDPNGPIIEFSRTLGTVPRSHMCVRNATSHAKFVYDWAPLLASLVIVIE